MYIVLTILNAMVKPFAAIFVIFSVGFDLVVLCFSWLSLMTDVQQKSMNSGQFGSWRGMRSSKK